MTFHRVLLIWLEITSKTYSVRFLVERVQFRIGIIVYVIKRNRREKVFVKPLAEHRGDAVSPVDAIFIIEQRFRLIVFLCPLVSQEDFSVRGKSHKVGDTVERAFIGKSSLPGIDIFISRGQGNNMLPVEEIEIRAYLITPRCVVQGIVGIINETFLAVSKGASQAEKLTEEVFVVRIDMENIRKALAPEILQCVSDGNFNDVLTTHPPRAGIYVRHKVVELAVIKVGAVIEFERSVPHESLFVTNIVEYVGAEVCDRCRLNFFDSSSRVSVPPDTARSFLSGPALILVSH